MMIRITLQERVSLPTVHLIFRQLPHTLPIKMKEPPGTNYAEISLVENYYPQRRCMVRRGNGYTIVRSVLR